MPLSSEGYPHQPWASKKEWIILLLLVAIGLFGVCMAGLTSQEKDRAPRHPVPASTGASR